MRVTAASAGREDTAGARTVTDTNYLIFGFGTGEPRIAADIRDLPQERATMERLLANSAATSDDGGRDYRWQACNGLYTTA